MSHKLRDLFSILQENLASDLRASKVAISHPGEKGGATEDNWIHLLERHLPQRYRVSKAFVIDAAGEQSEQIDVVIYDWQYTPLLYNKEKHLLIPAESVYAVFEVKQNLNRNHILYAGGKVASVRKLNRTSKEITHAGGKFPPRPPIPIIGGILAYESEWTPGLGKPFIQSIERLDEIARLDIGCTVTSGAFDITYPNRKPNIEISQVDLALVNFLFRLLSRLQLVGTVPAIDYESYIRSIEKN
jgi:hypothetical protein